MQAHADSVHEKGPRREDALRKFYAALGHERVRVIPR